MSENNPLVANDHNRSAVSSDAKSIVVYFALVLVLSLPFWVLGAYAGNLARAIPIALPVSALMLFCPLLAAVTLTMRARGRAGVKQLFARVLDARRAEHPFWLVAAALVPPVILLASYAIMRAAGQSLPEPSITVFSVLIMFVVFFFAAICEELGWTATLLDPSQECFGFLPAAFGIGAFWAFWHIVPYLQGDRSPTWIVWQCVFTIASRVVMVAIYNRAGGSVFSSILFHAMINVAVFSFPANGSHYDPRIAGILFSVVALAAAMIGRPRNL